MVYEIKTLHFCVGLIESFSGGGDVHILHGNDFNSFLTFESCFSEDFFSPKSKSCRFNQKMHTTFPILGSECFKYKITISV